MNITIVGGGFGGVKAALELAEDATNRITLISDKPDFQYYPALYSAATGHSHLQSWVPLGEIFAGKKNIHVKIDTITSINPKQHQLGGESGQTYTYEKCILGLGVVTTYFGIKGLDEYAYGIKSAEEIQELKHHIYIDIAEKKTLDKHYVVVGAGPTGVELAGALGAYLKRLCEHYGVKKSVHIDLIEAAPRILPKMSEKASRRVATRLKRLGVHIQTGVAVESATAEEVTVGGKSIKSQTVIWTSGVTNHPFYRQNNAHFTLLPNGRVQVNEFMMAANDVYVIGDNAGTPYTGLAQTALHDGVYVAKNLKREARGETLKKYKAVKPPVVVPVGEDWAVFEWRGFELYGWIAAMLRRAADFIGYNDVLPLGLALGTWHATMVLEDDYFAPSKPKSSSNK